MACGSCSGVPRGKVEVWRLFEPGKSRPRQFASRAEAEAERAKVGGNIVKSVEASR